MWNYLIRLKSGIKNVKLKSGIKNGSRDGRKNQKKVSKKVLKEYRHIAPAVEAGTEIWKMNTLWLLL